MIRVLLLMGWVLGAVSLAQAQSETNYPICDLVAEQAWPLPGESRPAILRTHLTSDGTGFPAATRELVFHDGQKLQLGGAWKIIDDFDGEFPSCEEHIERLHEFTAPDFTRPRTLSDLSNRALYVIGNPEACTDRQDIHCSEGGDVNFITIDVDTTDLAYLISRDALIVELLHSAYMSSTYAYDPDRRRFIEIYQGGC